MTSAPAVGTSVTVAGYPALSDRLVSCTTMNRFTHRYPTLSCDGLSEGASGSPWVTDSKVTAVIGGFDQGGCTDSVSYASRFGPDALALVRRAEKHEAGDWAPLILDDPCT